MSNQEKLIAIFFSTLGVIVALLVYFSLVGKTEAIYIPAIENCECKDLENSQFIIAGRSAVLINSNF